MAVNIRTTRSAQKGFTLIELMIVITIVGLLAAIAIPSFQNYTVRARVVNGLALASDAKALVSENAFNGEPRLDRGMTPRTNFDDNVRAVEIDPLNGEITITFGPKVESNATLVLVPESGGLPLVAGTVAPTHVTWFCDSGASTLRVQYRPNNCR